MYINKTHEKEAKRTTKKINTKTSGAVDIQHHTSRGNVTDNTNRRTRKHNKHNHFVTTKRVNNKPCFIYYVCVVNGFSVFPRTYACL